MKVINKGIGEPEIAVVACMHGDEISGKKALQRFLESDIELERPVKFVIANEKAIEEEKRFIDTDLNRCFPGDPESDSHEEKLASRLMEELESLPTLTLHSMKEFEELFCLVNSVDKNLIKAPGVGKAVDVEPLDKDSIEKYLEAVSVETGTLGSKEATENALKVLINFLVNFDAIDRKTSEERPELFEMYEVVEGDYEFLAENFEKVYEGEKFAQNEEKELRAEKAFYPILMSTDGYNEILGFKGRRPENELKGER